MTAAAAVLSDMVSALSAAAGGGVSVVAGLASAFVASSTTANTAGKVVVGALKAEALKIGLAVLLPWLVLTNYNWPVVPAFLGAVVVTMLIFAMAFFVRDY
jgi:ATP synthase protein I